MTSLGKRLRRKRTERKIGLREAARRVGISPSYLSEIETKDEKSPPAEDVIRRLSALLDDDLDDLMGLAGRVPKDVARFLNSDSRMLAFLRAAKKHKLSGDALMSLLPTEPKP